MKLHNEFEVAVPLERAWEALLDIERVASFLPGAKIEQADEDGVYRGSMKVKLGPMVVNYSGTARLGEVNEQERYADIAVEAREGRGQGTASAVIHNQLVPVNGGTRVVAETDLRISGRQAQFGRGIMQDVAGNMLGEFARRFERYLTEGEGAPEPAGEAPQPAAGAARGADADEEGLDVLSVIPGGAQRAAAAAGGALCLLLVAVLLRRRQSRGFEIRLSRSW
jgi:carbon monoxide dehydrogenase subunit G